MTQGAICMALTFKSDQYRTVESNISYGCANGIAVGQMRGSPFHSVELLQGNRWYATRGPFSAYILVSQSAEHKEVFISRFHWRSRRWWSATHLSFYNKFYWNTAIPVHLAVAMVDVPTTRVGGAVVTDWAYSLLSGPLRQRALLGEWWGMGGGATSNIKEYGMEDSS